MSTAGGAPTSLSSSSSSSTSTTSSTSTSSSSVIAFKKFVNTLSVDCSGRFLLLAGQKALYVLDIGAALSATPGTAHKSVQRESKRQASAAEWNPHSSHASLAAAAAHSVTQLYDLAAMTLLAGIQSHRRAVSDLSWSPHDANLLGTCSADTFVNVWDVRTPRSSLKLKAFCGYTAPADALRWSRLDRMLLASAHGNEVRVWDVRREAAPLALITAHMAKITALDWSYTDAHRLLTCSQDRTVKFWDVDQPRESLGQLHTGAPVQRAFYAPLGHGVATVATRGDCALRLWSSLPLPLAPVHTYTGHTEPVQAMAWRSLASDPSASLQLVSLGADQTIRLWRVEPAAQQAIGINVDALPGALGGGGGGGATDAAAAAGADAADADKDSSSHTLDLAQEFGLLNKLPGIVVDRADLLGRVCVVSCAAAADGLVRLKCTFPLVYPNGVAPQFNFLSATTLSARRKAQLKNELSSVAQSTVQTGKPCLVRCLRLLVAAVVSGSGASAVGAAVANVAPPVSTDVHQSDALSLAAVAALADVNLPAPRVSGVTWSPRGDLFFFANFAAPLSDECRTLHDFTLCRANRTHLRTAAATAAMTALSRIDAPTPARRTSNGGGGLDGLRRPLSSAVLPSDLTRGFLSATAAAAAVAAAASSGVDMRVHRWRGARALQPADEWLAHRYETGMQLRSQLPLRAPPLSADLLRRHELSEVCRRNGALAAQRNRAQLATTWKLVADVIDSGSSDADGDGAFVQSDGVFAGLGAMPWATHVLGAPLLRSVIDFYRSVGDIQTLAMLGVIVSLADERVKRLTAERIALAAAQPLARGGGGGGGATTIKRGASMLEVNHAASSEMIKVPSFELMPLSALQGDMTGIASATALPGISPASTEAQAGGAASNAADWTEAETLASSIIASSSTQQSSTAGFALRRISQMARRADTAASLNGSTGNDAAAPSAQQRKKALVVASDSEETWHTLLLSSDDRAELDQCRLYYTDLLFRWGAIEKRAELASMSCATPARGGSAQFDADDDGLRYGIVCARCGRVNEGKRGRSTLCDLCNKMPVACSLCRLPVLGVATFCIGCGHGGHAKHMAQWFARNTSSKLFDAESLDGLGNVATGPPPSRSAVDDDDDEFARCPVPGCGCVCSFNVFCSADAKPRSVAQQAEQQQRQQQQQQQKQPQQKQPQPQQIKSNAKR
jgi:hypothetical protein